MKTVRISLFRQLALIFAVVASPVWAEMSLNIGDTLQVRITGLAELDFEAKVLEDGTIDLDWMGTFVAAGQEINALESELQRSAQGKIVKQYSRDGVMFILQLEQTDVHLTRISYAGIIVAGNVTNPGAYAFDAGMTVRDAVALAGGAEPSLFIDSSTISPEQILRWQSDADASAQMAAAAQVLIWRLTAEADQDYDLPTPDPSVLPVAETETVRLIAQQRQIMLLNRENESGERAYFNEAEEQALGRIEILQAQQQKLNEALESDTAEELRVADLVERGLARSATVADVRRSTVLSATRLLELEETLARARLDVTRLQREAEAYDQLRLAGLLAARETAKNQLMDATRELQLLARYLGGSVATVGTAGALPEYEMRAVAFRRAQNGRSAVPLSEDGMLSPGDTLDVTMEPVAPANLVQN